jgi:hypothetical protein
MAVRFLDGRVDAAARVRILDDRQHEGICPVKQEP